MKKYILILLGAIILSNSNAAETHFEIYGVDPVMQSKILSCCKQEINNFIKQDRVFSLQQLKYPNKVESRKMATEVHQLRDSILMKIQKLDNFSFVQFSDVYYINTDILFVTLDIVKKSDSFRLPISPPRIIIHNMKKSVGVSNLLTSFNQYLEKNYSELANKKLQHKVKPCPFVHCMFGFDETNQKDYISQKEGAIKYQTELKALIEHSDNDDDRGNAVFLLANSNDYLGLAHYLIQYTNDSSSLVRNNVMRVLGAILEKHEIKNINLTPFLIALNYPETTDRNKALYSLYGIALKDKSSHSLIIKKSGETLLTLLKLKQPINHDYAYLILKEISKKNYSEHNYQIWKKWLESQQQILRKK